MGNGLYFQRALQKNVRRKDIKNMAQRTHRQTVLCPQDYANNWFIEGHKNYVTENSAVIDSMPKGFRKKCTT